ncbi:putative Tctex 1 family [Trypanosoma vivax]|uniref:Putative dynein light chain n=1 Tax=Trypanosoma vivax (strain Y486) TaxID=1055687 RepID=G0U7W2_TRYVY|nr:putative dynein light chain [Trypanosoma vivax]KAH8606233.1 putative Tctex 1 family [Trypanosoma vivax]KAH8620621.1 putative Tctex 1 family [Trypanosoma vivax]CCC51970.1 putative dynein light chain [Trypanosoma vivax Y486]
MAEKLTLADDAKGICEDVVGRHFMPVIRYKHEQIPSVVSAITEGVVQRLTQEAVLPRKYVAHCVIIQKTGAGFHALSACSWNIASDSCYVYKAENKEMYCIVTIYGVVA